MCKRAAPAIEELQAELRFVKMERDSVYKSSRILLRLLEEWSATLRLMRFRAGGTDKCIYFLVFPSSARFAHSNTPLGLARFRTFFGSTNAGMRRPRMTRSILVDRW